MKKNKNIRGLDLISKIQSAFVYLTVHRQSLSLSPATPILGKVASFTPLVSWYSNLTRNFKHIEHLCQQKNHPYHFCLESPGITNYMAWHGFFQMFERNQMHFHLWCMGGVEYLVSKYELDSLPCRHAHFGCIHLTLRPD